MLHRGDPGGECVLHRCDNRRCVNPEHLFLGSRTINSADKVSKGRQSTGFELPQTKLGDEQIAAIRNAQGMSQSTLAARYGVSQGYISGIRSGRLPRRLSTRA